MRRNLGFTLLEVLVAVSILGLGLSVILSSQAGLFATASRSENLSVATSLARCRMSETELDLLETGFPLVDSNGEGDCCEDESEKGFSCSWKVERVKLPEVSLTGDLEDGEDGGAASPLEALGELGKNPSEALSGGADLGGVAEQLMGGESGGGLAPMVMSMVYPGLKPMLEASIRKITVNVRWKEGKNDKTLSVVQYVTDPQQGELEPLPGELGSDAGASP